MEKEAKLRSRKVQKEKEREKRDCENGYIGELRLEEMKESPKGRWKLRGEESR